MNAGGDQATEIGAGSERVRALAIRTTDVSRNLDLFLAFGVAGVLGNRFFLVATGYPQVGNGTLHISHAIWGGAMMAAAIAAAVSFISPAVREFVAILGGAGFGWFVDELGKFITRDVNYFFRPTLAIIYSVFVAMYLLFRVLERRSYRSEERLLNAMEAVKAGAIGRLDEPTRLQALTLLDQVSGDDKLVEPLRELLRQLPTRGKPRRGRVSRSTHRLVGLYERWTVRRGYMITVIVFFLLLGATNLVEVLVFVAGQAHLHTYTQWATLISSVVSLALLIVGMCLLPRKRLTALRWFEAAILVSIFVTQVFLFADRQLAAVINLAIGIIVWVCLRSVIRLEVLARGVHESYRERRRRALGFDDPSLADWEALPETLRSSNRDQAAHFVEKLHAIDCDVVRYEGREPPPFTFTPQEVEVLARLEHERWVRERTRQGWHQGPQRDPATRTTPYLVDWEQLSTAIQDLDRDAVREMPAQLATAGFAVIRLRSNTGLPS